MLRFIFRHIYNLLYSTVATQTIYLSNYKFIFFRYSLIIRAGLTGHDNRLNRNRNYAIDYSKQFLESPSVNADKDHRLYGMNKKWFLEDMLWKQKNQKEYDVKSYGPIETIKRLRMIYYGMSQIRSYLDWPISGHSRVFKTKP